MKTYVILIKPFASPEFYAVGVNIGFRSDVDLVTELSGDEVVSRALGGELILIGPLEGLVPRMRRFKVSQDGYVREPAPSHGLITPLEQLLLRALYDFADAQGKGAAGIAEDLRVDHDYDDDDRCLLEELIEEERADRQ